MRYRTYVLFALAMGLVWCCRPAGAQLSSALSATTVPADKLIQPADLALLVNGLVGLKSPFVIQVGSQVFFKEAHITGSVYAGPGSQPAGLALLEKTVASLPKDKFIVIYCGCCPWNRCPNVGPAYKRLQELGYTNVKVVYFASNFGDDWVGKGYPTQK